MLLKYVGPMADQWFKEPDTETAAGRWVHAERDVPVEVRDDIATEFVSVHPDLWVAIDQPKKKSTTQPPTEES